VVQNHQVASRLLLQAAELWQRATYTSNTTATPTLCRLDLLLPHVSIQSDMSTHSRRHAASIMAADPARTAPWLLASLASHRHRLRCMVDRLNKQKVGEQKPAFASPPHTCPWRRCKFKGPDTYKVLVQHATSNLQPQHHRWRVATRAMKFSHCPSMRGPTALPHGSRSQRQLRPHHTRTTTPANADPCCLPHLGCT
jgi:hypothetical protein